MPFGNNNVMVELPGSAIWQAIENGLTQYEGKAGRFPQVSGLSFVFDESRPAGSRLVDVFVAGNKLVLDRVYKVATVDYMYHGGDGYSMLKAGRLLISPIREMSTVATVASYLKKNQNISYEIEGRITSLHSDATLDDMIGLP